MIVICLFTNCKDDDEGIGYTCENGYEWIDGGCQCPEGMYSAYGVCRELRENEWYGIMDECYCPDTVFIYLRKIEDGIAWLDLNENIDLSFPERIRYPTTVRLKHFELSTGDSLAPMNFPYGDLVCDVDGDIAYDYEASLYGKFTPDKSSLTLMLQWRDRDNVLIPFDTCYATFNR